MKRRVLYQALIVLTFLVFQIGYANDHPQSNRSGLLATAGTSSTLFAPTSGTDCQKTDKCFVFNYKGYQISTDGKSVTLTFSIKTNCAHDLSYAAFELPRGTTATATGTRKFSYKTSITTNPFPSIKFEGVNISGYKNGVEDVFKYVISKATFDKLTTIRVQAKAATIVGTVSFDKNCNVPPCIVSHATLTNVTYTSDGKTDGRLQNVVKQGKPVKVCFTVPASPGQKTYSFVSYTAPYPYFVAQEAHLQKVFDYKTIVVGPDGGTFCLEINVPNCFFQVDFVKGCIIEQLGPAGTNNFYSAQGRLIAFDQGGTVPCVPQEPMGNEGCTPGYWKQPHHFGNWTPLIPTGAEATKFFDVFNVCDQAGKNCNYRGLSPNLTLLEALQLGGGGFNALARHAAAAYLNAKSQSVKYSISSTDVVVGVINAFRTGNWSTIKDKLEAANEKGCPLGRSELTTSISSNVSELASEQQPTSLTAYPNPFNNRAVVRFTMTKAEEYSVSLYNANGKQVRLLKSATATAGEVVQLYVESAGLSEGLYLVRLVTKSETQSVKLLFKR